MSGRYDVIIVGAGAAGLACAGFAVGRGRRTLVVERNERPARKLMITGKGRCNLTNNCSPQDFIPMVRRGGKFLLSAVNSFSPRDTMDLFDRLGVTLKTERGNRVFPVSDRAADVVDALTRFAAGADILHRRCTAVCIEDSAVTGVMCGREALSAPAVVVATGGLSYPRTGSTGDGYKIAMQAGHNITPLRPSLVPLIVRQKELCARLAGLSLRNVGVSLLLGGKKVFSEQGEMLFTHTGVSGPLILSLSAHIDPAKTQIHSVAIDLKPAMDFQVLDKRILLDFGKYINRDFINALDDLLPRKLIPVVAELSGIPARLKVNDIGREQRHRLVALIKSLELDVEAFAPIEEAVITAGGVDTREIDPKTMQSKLVKGLYFAGEVLDADAYTGGYNLQIAFSTAFAAARNL